MSDATALAGPEQPPQPARDVRRDLANDYLRGDGIEIGALHLPMAMPPGAGVRYVDRMSVPDLRRHYAELVGHDLVDVDVIDDGETLAQIGHGSVDFIVANHFLEHCEDPIRTLETHLAKLRHGGILFYAVPDKRFTFDWQRPRTKLSHLIADHEQGPERSRSEHYFEWVYAGLVPEFRPTTTEEQVAKAAELEREGYSIHFHVWTEADLAGLFFHCRTVLGNFEVETVRRNGFENIVVARKHGTASPRPGAGPAVAVAAAVNGAAVAPPSAAAAGIPLAALREQLDGGSEAATWAVDFDGLVGRAWIVSTTAAVTVPLALDEPVSLRAHAALVPHDWRDGEGDVRVWIAAVGAGGRRRELWSRTLARIADPAGLAVECELPADTDRLEIGGEALGRSGDRTVTRFALLEPHLSWPGAGPLAPLAAPAPAPELDGPLISVLCPVHDPPLYMLTEALDSVLAQRYRNWELVLVDDGSSKPDVIAALDELQRSDRRVTLVRHDHAGGIATATNTALQHSSGEYVALLDHDDTLVPDALAHVAGMLASDPELDMVYSDEDIVLGGRPVWLHLKPAWSPDTENTNGYTCHLGVYRRALLREIGGFRTEFNGSQDVDMILRLTERTARVGHIPRILYHWRIHAASTAGGGGKPYAYVAARNAIAEHLEREEIAADVQFAPPGLYRVVHRVDPAATAAIVVAADDPDALAAAARSWLAQPHEAFTVVVATPPEQATPIEQALRNTGLHPSRVRVVPIDRGRGPGTALQLAAAEADADRLLLMERPMRGLTGDWMTRLIGYADQPGISAAGPFVLAEDGRVAHGGVAVPCGIPVGLVYGLRPKLDDFFGYATAVYNVAALDGALMTSRETFARLGGLQQAAGPLALVDYCLRAESELGLRAATIGDARLGIVDAGAPVNDIAALRTFLAHRRAAAAGDPYYNRGFRGDRGDFTPRAGR